MKRLFLTTFIALLIAPPAIAQSVHRMDGAQSWAQVERDQNGFSSCGVRVLVLDTDAIEFYDFTLRFTRDFGFGMVDAKKILVAKGKLKKDQTPGSVVTPAPTKFWIVKESDGKALTPQGYGDSKQPGWMVAGLPLLPTVTTILDIYKGERMQFALGYPGHEKEADRVISFKAPLSRDEQVTLDACIDSMLKRMKKG